MPSDSAWSSTQGKPVCSAEAVLQERQNEWMTTSPYAQSPDTFWLILPSGVEGLTAAPFDTAHGLTDEILGFFEGTMIGRCRSSVLENRIVINLTPTLSKRREYPWPTLSALHSALTRLLSSGVPYELGCEQDVDQAPVQHLEDGTSASLALAAVIEYCAGSRSDCPSFHYAQGRLP